MSDTALDKFLNYGTAAERIAFTPSPPPLATLYLWYETDTGDTYVYDSSWHLVSGTAGIVRREVVVMSDAAIKSSPTVPVELIAAAPSGFRYRLIAYTIMVDTTSGAYTGIDPTYADLHLLLGTNYVSYGPVDDATTTPVLAGVTALLGTVAASVYDVAVPSVASPSGGPPTFNQYVMNVNVGSRGEQEGAALIFAMDNDGAGNLGGGHADNTMTHTIYYALEAF
jgi:hypothetical protein